MQHVLTHGTKKSDRTGTVSVFGYQMRFDLGLNDRAKSPTGFDTPTYLE
jgi:thymidylate synthase